MAGELYKTTSDDLEWGVVGQRCVEYAKPPPSPEDPPEVVPPPPDRPKIPEMKTCRYQVGTSGCGNVPAGFGCASVPRWVEIQIPKGQKCPDRP